MSDLHTFKYMGHKYEIMKIFLALNLSKCCFTMIISMTATVVKNYSLDIDVFAGKLKSFEDARSSKKVK